MNKYLSHGGGVNSTALMLLLEDRGEEFEAVFCDTGGEYPETLDYIKLLNDRGHPIATIKPDVEGFDSLYDYAIHHKFIPVRFMRWCTDKFKIRPLQSYMKGSEIVYIGIDADEEHRAVERETANGLVNVYPLVEEGIGRQGCLDIIEGHGLPAPMKSGCFFCPFQRLAQWKRLRNEYPDLWCKAKTLEATTNARLKEEGREPIYLVDRPLDDVVDERQEALFKEYAYPPCNCGLDWTLE